MTKVATFVRDTDRTDGMSPGKLYALFPPLWYSSMGAAESVTDHVVITCWATSRGPETYAWPHHMGRVDSLTPLEGSINKAVEDRTILARMGYELQEET